MSRLAENLVDIFKVFTSDKKMLRLLYHPSNPLDPSLPDIDTLENFSDIKKERLLRAPKTDDLTSTDICRICMYFGNGSYTLNERVEAQDVIFDVYTHIDTFEMNEARSLKIIDHINHLFKLKYITGIGKMKSSRRGIIGNPPNGYIGYRIVYTFGSSTP